MDLFALHMALLSFSISGPLGSNLAQWILSVVNAFSSSLNVVLFAVRVGVSPVKRLGQRLGNKSASGSVLKTDPHGWSSMPRIPRPVEVTRSEWKHENEAQQICALLGTFAANIYRLPLKCDGTRAETRFRLSAKRTSQLKSRGRERGRGQFSRLLAAEVCASAVVMLDTPCSEVVWRVLGTHSIRQFPLHFPSCASPCAIIF